MKEDKYFPLPKKNWKKDTFQNYLDEKELVLNLDEYDFELEEDREKAIIVVKELIAKAVEKEVEAVVEVKEGEVKLYPVKLYRDHKCYVGGQRYEFLPRVEYYVPQEVRQVLIEARLVLA